MADALEAFRQAFSERYGDGNANGDHGPKPICTICTNCTGIKTENSASNKAETRITRGIASSDAISDQTYPVADSAVSADRSVAPDRHAVADSAVSADRSATPTLIPRPAEAPFGAPTSNNPVEWRDWLDERSAIREHLGCYSREEADSLAFGEAVEGWLSRFYVPPTVAACAGCGKPLDGPVLQVGNGVRVCDRHDHACLIRYGTARKRRGVGGLCALGIEPPRGWTLPDAEAP